ncbi:MAG: heat-inducible transcriptional repressor HrcA [Leptospirales bacterium]
MTEQITKRQANIIRSVVTGYIDTGQPVGSANVVENFLNDISSATVRKEMSVLEQMGYLFSPHTSAGRVPSDKAIEFYVRELIGLYSGEAKKSVNLEELSRTANMQLEKLMKATAQQLAAASDNAGIVLAPLASGSSINRVELVSVTGSIVLIIMVAGSGTIYQKKVRLDSAYTQEELYKVSRYLNRMLKGYDITDIRDKGLAFFMESDNSMGDLGNAAMQVAQNLIYTPPNQQVLIEGEASLYKHIHEEYSDPKVSELLINQLEDKSFICNLINDLTQEDAIDVQIGFNTSDERLEGISILTRSYSVGGRNIGALGVIGLKRMPYDKIIQSIDYSSFILSSLLNELSELDFDEGTIINIDGLPALRH